MGPGRVVAGGDPGEEAGWAITTDGTITDCGVAIMAKGRPVARMSFPALFGAVVYIEFPIYREHNNEMNVAHLLVLSGRAWALREHYQARGNRVVDVPPHGWKGMVPKRIHQPRILASLSPEERQLVSDRLSAIPEGLRHNGIDAVGIAVFGARKEGLRR